MTAANLLEIEALNVAVGATRIISNLSLALRAGEILGLVGASGSGKSMTALAIMRLLPAAASATGAVRLRGEALTAKSDLQMQRIRGRDMGMVFQEPMSALNPLMRIGDQVAETVRLHRSVSDLEARRAARETLDLVGLGGEQGALERLPYELSGGQRQRAAIAMAVIMAPPLLIADEPTTALDVITQAQVLLLLKDLARTRNMGLILVSHDLAVIAQLADRVAVMQAGQIVEQGATEQVLHHAQHAYTAALLAAAKMPAKRSLMPRDGAPMVLQACGIVQEYPRKRRSLWHAAPPLRAVDEVSLAVHAGETVGLVGESGSGKSSLLKVILALQRSTSGQVRLLGDDLASARGANLRRLRRAIQAVFQDPYGSFDPRWPVERSIAEPFFLLDSPPLPAERRRKVGAMLEQVGLSASDARRLPHEFSGGERQRIAIARAMITEPALIAFDEAVSALDVLLRDQILRLLAELSDRLKVAYLFVSHDLHVIRAIADRVYIMQQGRIVEEGPTEQLFASPRHAYTRALIAATPRIA
jgi:peptide/nickel transport system ATP-binding protein